MADTTYYPFFVDYKRGKLVFSEGDSTEVSSTNGELRPIAQADGTPIAITILDTTGSSTLRRYSKRSPNFYTVKAGIYLQSNLATQLAFQDTFTKDNQNNRWTGYLVQDSANVTAALGSGTEVDAFLEVKISEDGGLHFERALPLTPIKLKKEAITSGAVTVAPSQVAVTHSDFPTLQQQNLINGFILRSPNGLHTRQIYIDDDGQFQVSPVPQ